jgi:hypothetical protein
MPRLLTILVALSLATIGASSAHASLFFLFDPAGAKPGQEVVLRTGGTSPSFTLRDRVRPFQRSIRVYLVLDAIAAEVHSRGDARLAPIGTLVPDKNGHGILTFTVPNLKAGTYATAAWCPGCATHGFGRTFLTYPDNPQILPHFRTLMFLHVSSSGSAFPVATRWVRRRFRRCSSMWRFLPAPRRSAIAASDEGADAAGVI